MYPRCMHDAHTLPYWFSVTQKFYIWKSSLYAHCLHVANMLYLYLVAPNVRIKLFIDKGVMNWINNKLKDKKYHEVLTLTVEEFIEQEQNKKKREEDAEKTQPHRGPEPSEGEEGKCNTFLIYSMQTACGQCNSNVLPFFQWICTSVSFQSKITNVVQH